ncbi:sn-glycerol-3-phosphate ABC transporter ATP-binding protein UgpC [Caballeronia sp. SEWSISQ10-4 2]|uniref:ABC transporter ATP-binding protein n=1 Tax=Caballeronia sp. SEWSISQ10-4 2 TaxID=2937438 RepID=UPI00264E44B0|nr:sn-glycerol-3-phosphate ABC transporter ATP-binding protein UgpC [Caballeronia sp. SEWSISQ10-4 2]MDN7178321.1 sn-glycerol-3-phosphate ABC transporter ATP-binding protein UgpC [Caballeronia sp. SEWSISQ10-4 2]
MAEVAFKQVQKSFGAVQVLKQIDLTVADGEFLVLVGPSGCGKSTLLRALAGLEGVTHGRILIDGRVVNDLPPKDRDIAMVFQNYALYPHMSVLENLTFALKLRDLKPDEIAARANQAATILGLQDLLGRYPRHLSGGQRQRVAMGRAIVRDPKVFLFDEPLSNLDAKLRVQMRAEIKALHQRLRATTVYVTHDQIEAMTMADRIVVLNGGVIEQIGAPLELYDDPDNLFVASFIGSPSMNLFSGRYELQGSGARVRIGDFSLRVPVVNARDGQEVTVGVRPEHLLVAETGGIPFIVDVVEPTGASTELFGTVAGQRCCVIANGRLLLRPEQGIRLDAELDNTLVFDTKTSRRLR